MNENRQTTLIVIIAVVIIAFLSFSRGGFGFCGGGGYGVSMMNYMFLNPLGWMFGFLAMIILWGLAIAIIYYFIKMIIQSTKNSTKDSRRKR